MSSAFRLSIGANILLLGIVVVGLWRVQPAAVPVRPSGVHAEASQTDAAHRELQPKSVGTALTSSTIAQLGRMGISRDILINVLLEDLNRRSTKRLLELQKRYAPRSVPDHAMREFSRESIVEQIRELKEAFGEEGYLAWDKEQALHALNRARVPGDELPLTAAEAEQAYRLQKEFDEKNRELQIMMEDGVADTADTGTLQAQAQEALDRELEKLLGKERFNELRGNTDPTTEVYRTFGDLNPTPDQAKAVLGAEGDYRAREAALAERVRANPADAANLATELKELADAREKNLRQIFGAEAYNNMKRQNDPTYKTLQQYAEAWELKPPEVQSVYETLTAFFEQADRTRNAAELSEAAGQRVNWREINASIEQRRQQTDAGLLNLIGSERLRRLKQNGMLTAH
jgi:hypothetical protein